MARIIRELDGPDADVAAVPIERLDGKLIIDFQERWLKRALAEVGSDEPAVRSTTDRALRTSRSLIHQARCLFTKRGNVDMCARYASEGIEIPPNIDEFLTCRLRGRKWKAEYRTPSDSVVDRVLKEVEQLREDDQDVYLTFWLALGAGLRRKEIHFCRWEHFTERNGRLWIVGGIGKDGQTIEVALQSRAAEALAHFRKREGWVIRARADRPFKRLNAWMRKMGWTGGTKKMHELRALTASRLYVKNPVAAMRFLRHSSLVITEKFYLRFKQQLEHIDVF